VLKTNNKTGHEIMKQIIWMLFVASLVITSACTNTDSGFFGSKNGTGSLGGFDEIGSATEGSVAEFQSAVGDRVLFDVDQSTLNSEATSLLSNQAQWLISNNDYKVVLEGHADEQGTREYNLALGARRANSAKEYLVSLGVSGDRIQTVSYGKERPIEICSAESCYSQNRRAVSVLDNLGF
jgi:peptidoglycan-associated lipoprotein